MNSLSSIRILFKNQDKSNLRWFFSEYYLNNNDDQASEHYAKKCLEYVETLEHGTRVIRLLKEKDKDMSIGKFSQKLQILFFWTVIYRALYVQPLVAEQLKPISEPCLY